MKKQFEELLNLLREGMMNINWEPVLKASLRVMLILLAAWILLRIIKTGLTQLERQLIKQGIKEGESQTESRKRVETVINLLRQGARLGVAITVLLMILKQIGVMVGPVIASAGILGLALGFGAQNLVKDVISGFFIIMENQIRVGDVAIINGTGGLVEKIRFRTTILRDLGGVVHIFPNGEISTLSNMTKGWSAYVFDIGIAYKENTDRVVEVMRKVGKEMRGVEPFASSMLEEPEIFGVDKFDDSSVVIKGRVRTLPIKQWEVGREYLRRIKHAFDEQDIEIPFPHTSLYMGEVSKPLAVQLLEKQEDPAEAETALPGGG